MGSAPLEAWSTSNTQLPQPTRTVTQEGSTTRGLTQPPSATGRPTGSERTSTNSQKTTTCYSRTSTTEKVSMERAYTAQREVVALRYRHTQTGWIGCHQPLTACRRCVPRAPRDKERRVYTAAELLHVWACSGILPLRRGVIPAELASEYKVSPAHVSIAGCIHSTTSVSSS